jgi:hypothetical protein
MKTSSRTNPHSADEVAEGAGFLVIPDDPRDAEHGYLGFRTVQRAAS